jgi:energy-coupling factor transporter ATP-binding protein EcfA2
VIIKTFTAKKVFGYLDFSITFNSDINFLVGGNGSGKTTALRLINALLIPNFSELIFTPFSHAQLFLEDKGEILSIEAISSEEIITLSISNLDDRLELPNYSEEDNIFYGNGLNEIMQAANNPTGGKVFAYAVADPERYGVVSFDEHFQAISIEEKPENPKSNFAVPGLYFYDNQIVDIAKNLKPSPRGEYEITDVNRHYLALGQLSVGVLGRGIAWLDTGTHQSLMQAGQFIQVIEERQGLKIGCIEEVAWQMGFIDDEQLEKLGNIYIKSGYGLYLLSLLKKKVL